MLELAVYNKNHVGLGTAKSMSAVKEEISAGQFAQASSGVFRKRRTGAKQLWLTAATVKKGKARLYGPQQSVQY